MNTNRRYFYSDPLAAAWMAKKFAIEFSSCIAQNFVKNAKYNGDEPLLYLINLPANPQEKFYIHPDSVHLLEPKVGDIIFHTKMENAYRIHAIDGIVNFIDQPILIHGKPSGLWLPKADFSIIQRDGNVFMWPEVEAA